MKYSNLRQTLHLDTKLCYNNRNGRRRPHAILHKEDIIMPLFQKKEYNSPEEKKLSVLRFWFFVVGLFAFIIPLAVLYVVNMARGGGWLWAFALKPSLIIFVIVAVILLVVYYIYRAILFKNK